MIRGALIGRFLKQPEMRNIDLASDPKSRSLFFEDTTRFLNAYPQGEDNQQPRSLPAPRSLRHEKGDDLLKKIYDISHHLGYESLKNKTPKGLGDGKFCTASGHTLTFLPVKKRINIHNERNRKRGRATVESGQVFRYDAIDAGQTFQAVILTNSDDNAQKLIELLPNGGYMWFGGSQSAGYGKTLVIKDSIQTYSDSNFWCEVGRPLEQRLNQQSLRVTLLSDLILRDSCGQHIVDTTTVTEVLSEVLEVSLSPLKSYMGSSFIGGFNRKWGLPLPQVQAIAAGSIFVFDSVALDVERVQVLEFEGLGERRNEGFGRVAINWLEDTCNFEGRKYQQENYSTDDIKLHNASSIGLATLMAERLLRQSIEEKLLEKVSQFRIEGSITNSQLSRLSVIARKALQEDSPQLIIQLLENLPDNAKGQFSRSYLNGKSLDQCLREWVSNPGGCWTQIEPVRIAGESCDLTDELAREYMLRLIMAVCKKTNKERNYDERTA
jgi:CRISPR-associated protein Csx10